MNTHEPPTVTELLQIQRDRLMLAEAEAAIGRALELCDDWDRLSKGESGTTKAIRAALAMEES